MSKEPKKQFHFKSFTSFIVLLSFLLMTISGVILYFAPPGRVAHWSVWKFWALTKEQWQAQHTIFSLLFVIFSALHIYYNWSVLINYIKKKAQKGLNRKKEIVWATVLTILVAVLTHVNVPPFSTIMNWGEKLSESWSSSETEPPIPHAELMSLDELSDAIDIPIEQIMQRLKRTGIEPQSSQEIVTDLAERYERTPQELYTIIDPEQESKSDPLSGGGWGRKTVEDVCSELGISVSEGLKNLEAAGFDAKPGDNIRDLATQQRMTPMEVATIIRGNTEEPIEHQKE